MTRPADSLNSQASLQRRSADWQAVDCPDVPLWQSDALESLGALSHGFTGIGFNMSPKRGPDVAGTFGRWQRVCELIGADFERLAGGTQVHGTRIVRVGACGEITPASHQFDDCDALITDEPGVPLMALSADCPVLVVVDPRRRVLGVAHCGWRGTVAGLPGKLVAAMQSAFGIEPREAVAAIAPSAGACCYEIQDDVRTAVAAATLNVDRHVRQWDGRMCLDLASLIAEQVVAAGVPRERTYLPVQCTICDERFYSYRRQGANQGLAGLVACLR